MLNYIKSTYNKQNIAHHTLPEILALIVRKTNSQPKTYRRGYILGCPAHDDKHASFSMSQGDDGRILMYCFAGCTVTEICASLNINMRDLFPKKKKGSSYG